MGELKRILIKKSRKISFFNVFLSFRKDILNFVGRKGILIKESRKVYFFIVWRRYFELRKRYLGFCGKVTIVNKNLKEFVRILRK